MLLYETIESLEKRLEELRPAVEEAREIQRALDAIRDASEPAGAGGERRSMNARKRQILGVLAKHPEARVRDIAREIGVTDARVTQILKVMESEGTVRRSASGIRVM